MRWIYLLLLIASILSKSSGEKICLLLIFNFWTLVSLFQQETCSVNGRNRCISPCKSRLAHFKMLWEAGILSVKHIIFTSTSLHEVLLEILVNELDQMGNPVIILAGVAQWIECRPVNQRVTSWIPNQGTCLGWGPGPQLGVCKRQPQVGVSLPLFLPPFLSF